MFGNLILFKPEKAWIFFYMNNIEPGQARNLQFLQGNHEVAKPSYKSPKQLFYLKFYLKVRGGVNTYTALNLGYIKHKDAWRFYCTSPTFYLSIFKLLYCPKWSSIMWETKVCGYTSDTNLMSETGWATYIYWFLHVFELWLNSLQRWHYNGFVVFTICILSNPTSSAILLNH